MGVYTYVDETTFAVLAAKMFKAIAIDSDDLTVQAIPQALNSIQILEGDGGVGTIRLINFGEGSQIKQRVDEIDIAKMVYKYTILEGILDDFVDLITSTVTFAESADGGCICKTSSTYQTKGDFELEQEQLESSKGPAIFIFKAIEAYLVANPDYN